MSNSHFAFKRSTTTGKVNLVNNKLMTLQSFLSVKDGLQLFNLGKLKIKCQDGERIRSHLVAQGREQ